MSISYIKSQLPHGAMSEIAKRTKLSIYTISTVLSGKRKSTKEILILNTIADYLTELKDKEREALERVNAILSNTVKNA